MRLTKEEKEILKDAALASRGGGTWHPARRTAGDATRLYRAGFLLEAGIRAIPPHTLYVISEKGRKAVAQ